MRSVKALTGNPREVGATMVATFGRFSVSLGKDLLKSVPQGFARLGITVLSSRLSRFEEQVVT